MNNKIIIMVAGTISAGFHGFALSENTQQTNKQKDDVVNFSQLKVSGAQKQTPLVKALEKPGAYSAVGTENKLQSMDKIIRSMPGTYTQMDASQGTINVNIRGLSGFGRVNMMVDGVTQSYYGISPSKFTHGMQPSNDFGSLIDPNFIVEVEVEKGQLNGSNSVNALAGSANFRTLSIDDVIFKDNLWGVRSKGSWGDNGLGYNGMVSVAGKSLLNEGDGYFGGLIAVSGHNIPGSYKNGDGFDTDEFATDPTFKQKPQSQLTKLKYKPNDSHEVEFSGRFLQNKLTSRKINSEDYYLKYKYTPINELIDVEVLASHGFNTQKFQGEPIGGALKDAESENKSDSINISNTSRFSYGDTDFKWQIGSKLMKTKYQKITKPVEDPNTITYNPFSPSGTQDIASLYTQFEAQYDIYTATFDLNYLNYRVQGYKPACDETEKCFPQEASTLNLRESGINPGVLVSAQIIPEFQPFVSYAHSMRAPNSQEAFFSQNGGQSMNPFLKGEKAQTWQIGFNSFKPDLVVEGDQFNLKALWFHTHIKDYITSKSFMLCRATSQEEFDWCLINDDVWDKENPDIFQRADMYVNDPRDVNLRGYELQANYDAGVFYSMVSYTKESGKQPVSINSTSVFSAGDFTQLPEYYVTLDSGVRLFDEKLTVGSTVTWTGPSKRISPIPDGDMNGDAMTEKYEKQPTIVDLYADYEINKHFKLMMAINNLTNENYTDVLNRANSGAVMEERGRNNETGRGRSYMIGGQVRF
ncbi:MULTISPECIES: TonB-dependent receptor domain-containing protein [Providencia]|uniref:TonB-dependent receptor domain-containing protein n=1 Tax=Providencia TaxID=586 RepID=UPI0003E23E37|nr:MULTISPECIES: TonB-dependent receptor [Providencia]ETS99919.1 TonB-dependent receptor [Providencia alcalifaciens PAL-3]EUD00885.1 TonB-dependent receptor [Providencia alcalifaciens PAL-1]MTC21425.1 TonB-dependent receptor [Providencia sp. wls1938]MTC44547.1 TonB-dependent receptor [Providencia sp. wls1922]MTC77619.1 TonB-dependent receptor [Providencia sp. wls1916]